VSRLLRRILTVTLLVGAASAAVEVQVDRREDGVIVRSAIDQGNFLFRLSPAWKQIAAEEPWLVALEAGEDGARATLRLRIVDLPAGDLAKDFPALAAAYAPDLAKAPMTGEGGRRVLARAEGDTAQAALLLRDGPRLYLLRQDSGPADNPFRAGFPALAEGFTILDPKGPPPSTAVDPAQLAAEKLQHDYYRISLLKPEGFQLLPVDPDADEGIWIWLRRTDEMKNLCEIKVRVHLARTVSKSLEELAQAKIDAFTNRFEDTRVPRHPKRTAWPAASEAFSIEMSGKTPQSDIVVQQEWRLIRHGNDRIYEIEVTTYAGAKREFAKELRAFWRSIRIDNR